MNEKALPKPPKGFRLAKDSMGPMLIPDKALYGASTQRAVLNFPVSGYRMPRPFIFALGQLKLSCAKANQKLKKLSPTKAAAIRRAAGAVRDGKHDIHFPIDVYQTGSGTSTNMNANEVIANVCNQSLGAGKIHPNDDVNMGQSSNDAIPTAIHIAVLLQAKHQLIPALSELETSLRKKQKAFKNIYKVGRTHLQDATPVTLGQEFGGYAQQIKRSIERLQKGLESLRELPIGGTAVGTGINTHPRFAKEVCQDLNRMLNEKFFEAEDHFEAQSNKDACVEMSGHLKSVAVSLMKIANDIRWLGCGPRAGFQEIKIPPVQPGSSIMPGKVNPVIAESVTQVAAQVIGNDTAVTVAGMSSNFELNVMMPMMAFTLLESIRLLTNVSQIFATKCIDGIEADKKECEGKIETSLMLCTALVPVLGYDKSAELAKQAYKEGKTIRQVVLEEGLVDEKKLSQILNIQNMTE